MKGYICIVQNNSNVDYLKQAYGLALSLKNTQSDTNKLSIMVDEYTKTLITEKHKKQHQYVVRFQKH